MTLNEKSLKKSYNRAMRETDKRTIKVKHEQVCDIVLSADKITIPNCMRHYRKDCVEWFTKFFIDGNRLVHHLTVSYRNDKYNLINLKDYDTLIAMQKLYGCNVDVPVRIVKGLTYEQEAMCCEDYWIKVVD